MNTITLTKAELAAVICSTLHVLRKMLTEGAELPEQLIEAAFGEMLRETRAALVQLYGTGPECDHVGLVDKLVEAGWAQEDAAVEIPRRVAQEAAQA